MKMGKPPLITSSFKLSFGFILDKFTQTLFDNMKIKYSDWNLVFKKT